MGVECVYCVEMGVLWEGGGEFVVCCIEVDVGVVVGVFECYVEVVVGGRVGYGELVL